MWSLKKWQASKLADAHVHALVGKVINAEAVEASRAEMIDIVESTGCSRTRSL